MVLFLQSKNIFYSNLNLGGNSMDREKLIMELEQYYEAAGFSDVYNMKLKNMTDEELMCLYIEIFDDKELEL